MASQCLECGMGGANFNLGRPPYAYDLVCVFIPGMFRFYSRSFCDRCFDSRNFRWRERDEIRQCEICFDNRMSICVHRLVGAAADHLQDLPARSARTVRGIPVATELAMLLYTSRD